MHYQSVRRAQPSGCRERRGIDPLSTGSNEIVRSPRRSAPSESKPGLGFWKLYRRLRRLGHDWNHKRIYWVYCLRNLSLRRRTKKRVPPRDPMPLVVPERSNQVWSADFMSDALSNGVRL